MATSLEEISAQLKSAIELIQGNNRLTRDITGLDAQDDANVRFANPRLLPNGVTPEEAMEFSDPASSPYPDKVLQALWIIADIVTKNETISARNTLKTCFLYLDNTQYVPHIIDEKTYQAGLAVFSALEQVNIPWILKRAVDVFLKKSVNEQLIDMKNTLKSRLMRYEAHGTPERLEETLRHLKINQELGDLAQQEALPLDSKSHINALYQEIQALIESPDLSTVATDRLILDRETQLQTIRERIASYEQFNALWQHTPSDKTPAIHHSRYALMVAVSPPEAIVTEWHDLLTPSCVMIDTPVTPEITSLIEAYQEKTAPLTQALQFQIDLLGRYAETIPALTLPTCLQRDPTTHALTYVLTESTHPEQQIQQEENACLYQQLIDELQAYEKIVLTQCQRMRNHPMPEEQLDASPQTEQLFAQINQNVDNQLEQLRGLQTKALQMASYYAALIAQNQKLATDRTSNHINDLKEQIKSCSENIEIFQKETARYHQAVLSLHAQKIQYLGQRLDLSQQLIEKIEQNAPITDEDLEELRTLFENEPLIIETINALRLQRQHAHEEALAIEAAAKKATLTTDTIPFDTPPIDSTRTAALVATKAAARAAAGVALWGKKMGAAIKTQATQAVHAAQETYTQKQPALLVDPLQELCTRLKANIAFIVKEKEAIDAHQEPTQAFQTNKEYMRLHHVFQTTSCELRSTLQSKAHMKEQKQIVNQQLAQANLKRVLICYEKLLSTPATRRDYMHLDELSDIGNAIQEVSRLVDALSRAQLGIESHCQRVHNPNELPLSEERGVLLIDYQELLDKKNMLNEKYVHWQNVLRDLIEKKQATLDAIERARLEEEAERAAAAQGAEDIEEESDEETESFSSSDHSSIASISMEDEQMQRFTAPKDQAIPTYIKQRFFAPNTGLLRQYDAHFSWHDFFAEMAHLFLSCFVNYQTEKSKQHDFITELDEAQDLVELKQKAQEGQKRFHLKSVTLQGEPNEHSLDSLVSDLLNQIEPDGNTQTDEPVTFSLV